MNIYHRLISGHLSLPLVRQILSVLLILLIANVGLYAVIRWIIVGQSTCIPRNQIASDSRCLYIFNNKVFSIGTKSNPHHGHSCGIDVTSIMPSYHVADIAKYFDPHYVGDVCTNNPSPTPIPTPIPTPTLNPTATPVPTPTSSTNQSSPTPQPTDSNGQNLTPSPTQSPTASSIGGSNIDIATPTPTSSFNPLQESTTPLQQSTAGSKNNASSAPLDKLDQLKNTPITTEDTQSPVVSQKSGFLVSLSKLLVYITFGFVPVSIAVIFIKKKKPDDLNQSDENNQNEQN